MERLLFFFCALLASCESSPSMPPGTTTRQEGHPDSLLAPARAALNDGEYGMAKIRAQTFAEKHPNEPVGIAAKALIVQADSLTAVEKKAKAAKLERMKKPMRKKVDDMEGTTWYYAPSTPHYTNRNSFHVYMGEKDGTVWLRLRIQYYADDWLFIQKYVVKADSALYTIIPMSRVETDNDGGKIWETLDESVSKTDYIMLRDISQAKVVKVRFSGRQYSNDRVLSAAEKQGVAQMLDLYEAMGGKPGG